VLGQPKGRENPVFFPVLVQNISIRLIPVALQKPISRRKEWLQNFRRSTTQLPLPILLRFDWSPTNRKVGHMKQFGTLSEELHCVQVVAVISSASCTVRCEAVDV